MAWAFPWSSCGPVETSSRQHTLFWEKPLLNSSSVDPFRWLWTWWSWARSGFTGWTLRRGRGQSWAGNCDRRLGLRAAQSRFRTPAAFWTRTIGLLGHPGEVWRTQRSRTWRYCGRTLFWSPEDESRNRFHTIQRNHIIQMLPPLCQIIIQPVSSFHLIRAASIFGTYINSINI